MAKLADAQDLLNLSGKAWKPLLESPKFGGNPYYKNSIGVMVAHIVRWG